MTITPVAIPIASKAEVELMRQLDALLEAGLPAPIGLDHTQLREIVRALVPALPEDGTLFAVVLRDTLLPPALSVPLLRRRGKPGFTSMESAEIARFGPTKDVEIPDADAYLVTGIDTGSASLNVPPQQALPGILSSGRSPLTIAEGISLLLTHPDLLDTANCFSLLGSRAGDKRVPALWVKGDGRPRLGWCWDGAPHTWLGSASCADGRACARALQG